MARQRGGFRQDLKSRRRLTSWAQGPGDQSLTSISTTSFVVLGLGIGLTVPGLTVVRIRGELTLRLTSAGAADNGFVFTYGIGIVSSDAFAIGATVMPNPQDDMSWPGWMWHGFTTFRAASATLADLGSANVVRKVVDVKAMRKLGENEILFAAIDSDESGTATATVSFDSRLLVKLP